MPKNTENLNLYEVDPSTDGNMTFNIDTMMNDNWDKLDAYAGGINAQLSNKADIIDGKIAPMPSIADVGGSNKNLLINWDFRNPVNQRGLSEYTGVTYTVDMWQLNANRGKLNVNNGYITLTNTAASGAEYLRQGFERNFETGDVLTLSAEIRGNGSGQLFLGNSTDGANIGGYTEYTATSDWQVITFTKTLESTLPKWWVIQVTGQNAHVDIRRAKLELGSVSTLQNDPPADKAEQENLCARFGSNGEFITGPLYSNPNLLDNWYFAGGGSQQGGGQFPINQRGATSYAAGSVDYTIDRWRKNSTSVLSLTNDYLSLSDNWIYQRLEWAMTSEQIESNMVGKTYTLSVLTTDGLFSATKKIESSAPFIYDTAITNGSIRIQISDSGPFQAVIFANSGASINLIAAKLELGPVQTLAHQDAEGNWVLHDSPPNFQQELAKCQRYFIRYNQVLSSVGIANSSLEMSAYAIYQIPPMRVKPVINFSGLYLNSGNHSGANSVAVTSVETPPQGGSGAYAGTISTSGGLTAGETSIIQIRGTGCYIEFDANL